MNQTKFDDDNKNNLHSNKDFSNKSDKNSSSQIGLDSSSKIIESESSNKIRILDYKEKIRL